MSAPASPLFALQQHFDFQLSLLHEQPPLPGLADLLSMSPPARCQSAPLEHEAPTLPLLPGSTSTHLTAHQQAMAMALGGEAPEQPSPSLLGLPPEQQQQLRAQQAQQAALLQQQRAEQQRWCAAAERLLLQSRASDEAEGDALGSLILSLQSEIEDMESHQGRQERLERRRRQEGLQRQQAQLQRQQELRQRQQEDWERGQQAQHAEWEAAQRHDRAEWEARRAAEQRQWEARRQREQAAWEAQRRREEEEWEAAQRAGMLPLAQRLGGQDDASLAAMDGRGAVRGPRLSAPGCLQRPAPLQGLDPDWWRPAGASAAQQPAALPTAKSRPPAAFQFERSLTSTNQGSQRGSRAAAAAAGPAPRVPPEQQQRQQRAAAAAAGEALAGGAPSRKRRSLDVPALFEVQVQPHHRPPLHAHDWDCQTQQRLAQQQLGQQQGQGQVQGQVQAQGRSHSRGVRSDLSGSS
ncbi:hypothetical protein CHLNCDRAFT_140018 [Chlorella variabilis]|uniref:Uncharacterized protein n=1 Tax=Chlorella variabilis TaxID=554065 RepID=E1ZRE3_CHLVA|nr:hypothetical protein CHLNCDRAFT_140018 [Chlorella variabilis]EFN51613.1 hypothetical protein CHLNCDRAFT_140018 [Chlorella variabilis]|eukprot:XP_005843715.1 hypothetical protein CHLNCDRAFT_140018 [Chlorella variabilis]